MQNICQLHTSGSRSRSQEQNRVFVVILFMGGLPSIERQSCYGCFCNICRTSAELQKEANVSKLHHRNIVALYGAVCEPDHYGIVMEFVLHGALDEYILCNHVCSYCDSYRCLHIFISADFIHTTVQHIAIVYMRRTASHNPVPVHIPKLNYGHFAHWTVSLLFGHFTYWTHACWSFRLQDISPTGHFAYGTFRLLDSLHSIWTFRLWVSKYMILFSKPICLHCCDTLIAGFWTASK